MILLMDIPNKEGRKFNLEELKQLKDCGIKTVLHYGSDWNNIDFDEYLEQLDKVGLKALVPIWNKQRTDLPEEWYLQTQRGRTKILSIWNKEAQECFDKSLEDLIKKYSSDKIQFILSYHADGETVLLNEPAYYDQEALKDFQKTHSGAPADNQETKDWLKESYTKFLLDKQKILVKQQGEIWFMLHRMIARFDGCTCHGCEYIDDYIKAFRTLTDNIYHISYTYFPHGPNYFNMIKPDIDSGIKEIGGAEYCEGLRGGFGALAKEHHLTGLVVAPCHPFTDHVILEPWMLDSIKLAIKQME